MRIVVNLSTGNTLTLQLPSELGAWQRHVADPVFQGSIRGVGVIRGTEYITLPVPKLFDKSVWEVEVVKGESDELRCAIITLMADDVMVRGTIYNTGSPSMTKIEVRRMGKRRWKP